MIVEADVSRWDKDKVSDVRNVGNDTNTLQKSKLDTRDSSSQLSTFLRPELVDI
jgi:hypothetical protein